MRTNRHQRYRLQPWVQYRPSGGKRIGRGAGRRRHYQAVRALAMHELAIDRYFQFNQARHRAFAHHHIVQRKIFVQHFAIMKNGGGKQHALLDIELARQNMPHGLQHGFGAEIGEETETAALDIKLLGCLFFDQDMDLPLSHKIRERKHRLPDFGAHIFADKGNGFKCAFHGWH